MLGKMLDFYISRYQLFTTSFKIFLEKIFVANFPFYSLKFTQTSIP